MPFSSASVQDLGITISSDGTFNSHISNIISKLNQRIGLILRTFNNRSPEFMKFCWKVYLQPILDYGSQLWAPAGGPWLKKLENILKSFTSKINGMKHLDYWTRLSQLKISSVQRRFERYRIFYTWKIIKGIVPNCNLEWHQNVTSGLLCKEPQFKKYDNNIRENSFHFNGARLYNSLPRAIRDNISATKDEWKIILDDHLSTIPDNPAIDGCTPEPCDRLSTKPNNSIVAWTRLLKINDRRTADSNLYVSL